MADQINAPGGTPPQGSPKGAVLVNLADTSLKAAQVQPGQSSFQGLEASQADHFATLRSLLRLAKREEQSGERDEHKRRSLILEAARLMAKLESEGVRRTTLYREANISRQEGRNYMSLALAYAGIEVDEMQALLKAGRILSLNQAAALRLALKGLGQEERQRLILLVRHECPEPSEIGRLVPQARGDSRTLKEYLKITEDEVAALRANGPEPLKPQIQARGDRILVRIQTPATLPSLFAALTADGETVQLVTDQLRSGGIIEVRGIDQDSQEGVAP